MWLFVDCAVQLKWRVPVLSRAVLLQGSTRAGRPPRHVRPPPMHVSQGTYAVEISFDLSFFYATLPISSAMMMFGFPKMSCLSRYSYWQTLHFDLFLFLVTSHRYCHQVWLLMSINVSVHLQQMTVTVSDGQNSFTEYQMSDTVLWSVIYSWEPLVFLNLRLCWILCLAVTFKT